MGAPQYLLQYVIYSVVTITGYYHLDFKYLVSYMETGTFVLLLNIFHISIRIVEFALGSCLVNGVDYLHIVDHYKMCKTNYYNVR